MRISAKTVPYHDTKRFFRLLSFCSGGIWYGFFEASRCNHCTFSLAYDFALNRICRNHAKLHIICSDTLPDYHRSVSLRHDDFIAAAHSYRRVADSGKAVSLDCAAAVWHARLLLCLVPVQPICWLSCRCRHATGTGRTRCAFPERCRAFVSGMLRRRPGVSAGNSGRLSQSFFRISPAVFLLLSCKWTVGHCVVSNPSHFNYGAKAKVSAGRCCPLDSMYRQCRKKSAAIVCHDFMLFRALRHFGRNACSGMDCVLETAGFLCHSAELSGNQQCDTAFPAVLPVFADAVRFVFLWRMLCSPTNPRC